MKSDRASRASGTDRGDPNVEGIPGSAAQRELAPDLVGWLPVRGVTRLTRRRWRSFAVRIEWPDVYLACTQCLRQYVADVTDSANARDLQEHGLGHERWHQTHPRKLTAEARVLVPPSEEWDEFLKKNFMPEYRAGHFDDLLADLGLRRKSDLRGGARRSVARPIRDELHVQRGGTDKDEADLWTRDLAGFEDVAALTNCVDGEAVVPRDRSLLRAYREWYRALRHRATTPPAIVTDVVPPWPSEATLDDLAPGSRVSRPVLVTVALAVVGVRRLRRGVYDTRVARRSTPAPSRSAYLLVPTSHPAAAALKLGLPEDAFDHPRGVAFRRLALEVFRELPPLPENIHQRRRRWSERHV